MTSDDRAYLVQAQSAIKSLCIRQPAFNKVYLSLGGNQEIHTVEYLVAKELANSLTQAQFDSALSRVSEEGAYRVLAVIREIEESGMGWN